MSSNSSGPASPFNADEAEQLAAQFRPVWDVEEATPAPEVAAAEPSVAPPIPVAKATVRWAPGNGPGGFPAPAPPAPLPAPGPRKRRDAPPAPEVRELTGDVNEPVSSDGAVAMALVTGPVLPPKAAEVIVAREPSIVVKDVAAMARAIADEPPPSKQDDEARRRQTVRLDDLRKDPALEEMYAKYEKGAPSAPVAAEPAAPPPSARASKPAAPKPVVSRPVQSAPVPEVEREDESLPVNNNRKIVFGAVGVAALLAILGIAKATLSDKDDGFPPAGSEATTKQTGTPGASPVGTTPHDATNPHDAPTAHATNHDPPAKPTTDPPAKPTADPAAKPTAAAHAAPADLPATPPKKDTKAVKAATPPPAPPPAPPPPATDKKKPATKGGGGIVRDAPF